MFLRERYLWVSSTPTRPAYSEAEDLIVYFSYPSRSEKTNKHLVINFPKGIPDTLVLNKAGGGAMAAIGKETGKTHNYIGLEGESFVGMHKDGTY